MKVTEHKIAPTACVECGHVADVSAGFGDAPPPEPGHFVICVACTALNVYDDDLQLRALTAEEMVAVAGSPALRRTMELLTMERARREAAEKDGESHAVPESVCPECGARNDRAFDPGGATPRPGDWSICITCSALSAFAEDLSLRPLTEEEMIEAAGDPNVRGATNLLSRFREETEG